MRRKVKDMDRNQQKAAFANWGKGKNTKSKSSKNYKPPKVHKAKEPENTRNVGR